MNPLINRLAPQDQALFAGLSDDDADRFFAYMFGVPKAADAAPALKSQVIGLYDPFCDRRVHALGILWQCAPYSFCDHKCAYCYGRSYLHQFCDGAKVKPFFRRDFERCLTRMRQLELPPRHLSMANSTDVLQAQLEREHRHTLFVLHRLRDNRDLFSSVCILTRAPDVLLDAPDYVAILKATGVEVQVSIAFWRDSQSQALEPGAPPVSVRRQAVARLIEQGVAVALRVDPLFPHGIPGCTEYQSQDEDIAPLIKWGAAVGVSYVISSPLKQVYRRNRVQNFYDSLLPAFQAVRGGYRRMPEELQRQLMSEMHQLCAKNGLRLEHCFCNILKRNGTQRHDCI